MESLGLAGMFTCLPPVRGGAVQIPEYTAGTGQRATASQTQQRESKEETSVVKNKRLDVFKDV